MRLRPAVIPLTICAALLLAGCGAGVTQTVTVTQTVVQTKTVVKRLPPRTVTQTAAAAVAPTTSTPAPSGPPLYRGNGAKNVGTITVMAPSTLEWASQGGLFSITSNIDPNTNSAIALDSQAGSGTTAVDPGTYSDVQVFSYGNWGFKIVPG